MYDKLNEPIGTCSSSIISDDGYILTAGHCLYGCLGPAFEMLGDHLMINPAKLDQAICKLGIDGKIFETKIIAVNRCVGRSGRWVTKADHVRCTTADFAILKIDKSIMTYRSCLRLSPRKAMPGEGVISMGFPGKSYRRFHSTSSENLDSDGEKEYISPGQVIPFQGFCDPKADKDYAAMPSRNIFDPKFSAQIYNQIELGNIIQTSRADIIPGSSGGPLLDSSMQISGMAEMTKGSRAIECVGGTFYTSTKSVLDSLKADYPSLDLSRIFHCDEYSIEATPGNDVTPTLNRKPMSVIIDFLKSFLHWSDG